MNVWLLYGCIGECLFVSLIFYCCYYVVGYGYEGIKYGCNFGVLFLWWDMMFGIVLWNCMVELIGICEQVEGVFYGDGFWLQYGLVFVWIFWCLFFVKCGVVLV